MSSRQLLGRLIHSLIILENRFYIGSIKFIAMLVELHLSR